MGYLFTTSLSFSTERQRAVTFAQSADDVFRPCQRFVEPSHHAIYHNYHLGITGPIATSGRFAVHGRNQPQEFAIALLIGLMSLQFSILAMPTVAT